MEANNPPHINRTHQGIVNKVLRWGEVTNYVLRSLGRVLKVVGIPNYTGFQLPGNRALLGNCTRVYSGGKRLIKLE